MTDLEESETTSTNASAKSNASTMSSIARDQIILAMPPLILAIVYLATTYRTVGPGDAGELTIALTSWGVAHPPGYPLYTMLGNLWSRLPFPGEPAFATNLLSAFLNVVACSVLAVAIGRTTKSATAGAIGALVLGTSRLFWEYSLVAEVFALNNLAAATLFFALTTYRHRLRTSGGVTKAVVVLGVASSLAVTHHTTLVMLVVPVLVGFLCGVPTLRRRRDAAQPTAVERAPSIARLVALGLAAGVVALLPLVYLPIAASADPPLAWGQPDDIGSLWHHVARKDYASGALVTPGFAASHVVRHGEDTNPLGLRHLWRFFAELPRSFGWFALLLPILGLLKAWRTDRVILVVLLIFGATLVPFFDRVNAPFSPLFLGVADRFFILPHVVFAFTAGLGAAWLLERTTSPRLHLATAVGIVLLVPGVNLVRHWPHVDGHDNVFTRDFGANVLASMPENGLLFGTGDMMHNAVGYQQICLGARPDVDYVHVPQLTYDWYVDRIRRRTNVVLPGGVAWYRDRAPSLSAGRWFAANAPSRPVAVTKLEGEAHREAGYRLVAAGMVQDVYRADAMPSLATRRARLQDVRSKFATASLHRVYDDRSFERDELGVYLATDAAIAALSEIAADIVASASASSDPSDFTRLRSRPAFERAASLAVRDPGKATALAATAVAYVNTVNSLPPTEVGPRVATLVRKAIAMAEASRRNGRLPSTAARLLALLERHRGRGRDVRREARFRIDALGERPGDLEQLNRLTEAMLAVVAEPVQEGDVGLLQDFVAVQRRFVRLLDIAIDMSDEPSFHELRRDWRRNLANSEAALVRRR